MIIYMQKSSNMKIHQGVYPATRKTHLPELVSGV